MDIRCAMASYEVWSARAFQPDQPAGSLNLAITTNWPGGKAVADGFADVGAAVDRQQQPNRARIYNNKHTQVDDFRIIWEFLKTLGDTYYGKQFISQLNQTVCAKFPDDLAPVVFTDIPTNEGGWVDDGTSILGLNDDDGLGFLEMKTIEYLVLLFLKLQMMFRVELKILDLLILMGQGLVVVVDMYLVAFNSKKNMRS